jgi:hypothetical protein
VCGIADDDRRRVVRHREVDRSVVVRLAVEAVRIADRDDRRERKVRGDQVHGALVVREHRRAKGRRERNVLFDH